MTISTTTLVTVMEKGIKIPTLKCEMAVLKHFRASLLKEIWFSQKLQIVPYWVVEITEVTIWNLRTEINAVVGLRVQVNGYSHPDELQTRDMYMISCSLSNPATSKQLWIPSRIKRAATDSCNGQLNKLRLTKLHSTYPPCWLQNFISLTDWAMHR